MAGNKLFTNLITGTAIIASLATGGIAGIKVFANKGADTTVPEISTPTPSPMAVVPSTGSIAPIATAAPTHVEPVADNPIVPVVDDTVFPVAPVTIATLPIVSPSPNPSASDFPVASVVPGSKIDDDGNDDKDELEHEDSTSSDTKAIESHETQNADIHKDN